MKEEISLELARVHAHLCGDGYVCIWKTSEKGRQFRATIGYCNNNFELIKRFRSDFNKIFGVNMTINRVHDEVYVRSLRIYHKLINTFGLFGSRYWKISSLILNSNEQIKLEWLKAFFDDEAYHEKRYNRLKIKSMNFNGLKDVQELLKSLNVFSSLTGPNCDGSYYLTIPQFSKVECFSNFSKEPARKSIAVLKRKV